MPPAAMATPLGKVFDRSGTPAVDPSGKTEARPLADTTSPSVARYASTRPPQRRIPQADQAEDAPRERRDQHEPDELLGTRPKAERGEQLDVAAADQLPCEQAKADDKHQGGEP